MDRGLEGGSVVGSPWGWVHPPGPPPPPAPPPSAMFPSPLSGSNHFSSESRSRNTFTEHERRTPCSEHTHWEEGAGAGVVVSKQQQRRRRDGGGPSPQRAGRRGAATRAFVSAAAPRRRTRRERERERGAEETRHADRTRITRPLRRR